MRVFLTGVACVGKTTIGAELAESLGAPFHDVCFVVEEYFGTTIPKLKAQHLTEYSYRCMAVEAFIDLLDRIQHENWVIALPPSGLMYPFGREVRKTDAWVAVLHDKPANILDRITFYDDDQNLIETTLTDEEKKHYLREIRKDITYFKRTYRRAHFTVNLAGRDVQASVAIVRQALEQAERQRRGRNAEDSG